LFVDMNSYFASAEQHLRPELRGRPIAVVPVVADTTCCIAASYEAKVFGIKTGTAVAEAKEKCPGIRLIEARPELYIELHHRIVAAVESCLPVLAVLSIDEMACRLRGPDREPEQAVGLARQIKETIQAEIGPALKCSIGIAPNRLLAKAAAYMHKPDGLTVIGRDELPQRLYELPLRGLCGIGARMDARLNSFGITTVERLCHAPEDQLCRLWGSQVLGSAWWRKLRGEDVPEPPTQRRTLGHSQVLLPELRRDDLARRVVIRLIHKAGVRLRHTRYWARSISVHISFLGRKFWHQGRRFSPRAGYAHLFEGRQ
jgi:DNA polymerase-4